MTELDVSGDRLVVKRGRGRRVPRGCLESGFMVILYEDGLSGFGSLALQIGHVYGLTFVCH